MTDLEIKNKEYAEKLFNVKGIPIKSSSLLHEFVTSKEILDAIKAIEDNQTTIMEKWKIKTRVSDILSQQIVLPNATQGKPYTATMDLKDLNLSDLAHWELKGLQEIGLDYDKTAKVIEGTPSESGNLKFEFLFKLRSEQEDTPLNEKFINLIVNPDPKTLWKNIPTDKEDIFWKEDNVSTFSKLGEKHIVVSSKRGRSHQNVGSFREDDFSFEYIESTGWSIVAVADGAGSYSLSRKGSLLACEGVTDYFRENTDDDKFRELETNLEKFNETKDEILLEETKKLSKQILYKATLHVHNTIKKHSESTIQNHPALFNNSKAKSPLDYYHSTLIFALYKKYDFGYVVLTFGVGDCPIALMNSHQTETKMLNWLDVGEFGGGTRFITQPEIFHSTERPMATRFNFTVVSDFSHLFLMSDGIYDPKFVVEANLEKHEKWMEFLSDLGGKNEDNRQVIFDPENQDITQQLSEWMDFWSAGNHDDRTLAIIF